MISPVRKTVRSGKARPRLVGVVDGTIDAVAEPEFPREMQRQTARGERIAALLDLGDERAVIVLGQLPRDGRAKVESFSEDQWRHHVKRQRGGGTSPVARGVRSSSAWSSAVP